MDELLTQKRGGHTTSLQLPAKHSEKGGVNRWMGIRVWVLCRLEHYRQTEEPQMFVGP